MKAAGVWIWLANHGSQKICLEITRRFLNYARQKKDRRFCPLTEKFAQTVTSNNVRIVKVGASPYFDLNWDPRGIRKEIV